MSVCLTAFVLHNIWPRCPSHDTECILKGSSLVYWCADQIEENLTYCAETHSKNTSKKKINKSTFAYKELMNVRTKECVSIPNTDGVILPPHIQSIKFCGLFMCVWTVANISVGPALHYQCWQRQPRSLPLRVVAHG